MSDKKFMAWEKEKKLIPQMIKMYCCGRHKDRRKEQEITHNELCSECRELCDYSLYRLEKCPFKENKEFCSFCKIHCYKPEMKEKVKKVMKYAGPRMIFSHPIFAVSHVVKMINYKKQINKEEKHNDR